MFSSKISIGHKKSIIKIRIFVITKKLFLLKYTFKVKLQYIFSVFILFYTTYHIKLKVKLNIDLKMCTIKTRQNLENLEKIGKWQTSGNPAIRNSC